MSDDGRRYRITYTYRQWVGKPDPSGFGRASIDYFDPSAAHEAAMKLRRDGHANVRVTPITIQHLVEWP
jgi:hypothetical protein